MQTVAQNMVVLKTMSGLAGGACEALDHMDINGMVGTLAGDEHHLCGACGIPTARQDALPGNPGACSDPGLQLPEGRKKRPMLDLAAHREYRSD